MTSGHTPVSISKVHLLILLYITIILKELSGNIISIRNLVRHPRIIVSVCKSPCTSSNIVPENLQCCDIQRHYGMVKILEPINPHIILHVAPTVTLVIILIYNICGFKTLSPALYTGEKWHLNQYQQI